MRILAATDFSTRSQRAVRRAGLLAHGNEAELILLNVVDDDQPRELVDLESREAQRCLEELIGSMAELRGVRCQAMVVAGNAFDGILRTAESLPADLIVMGAHRKQLLRDIFVGTTVERVIRTGSLPVLMVNAEVGRPYEKVIAAVDLSEPSAHAIKTGKALGLIRNAALVLVHAFTPLAEGKMALAGIDENKIRSYVADEHERARREIAEFLEVHDLAGDPWSFRIRKGGATDVISDAVKGISPDLLVIGTHGRSGILKILLGSVTENALRTLDVDTLAVPPPRR